MEHALDMDVGVYRLGMQGRHHAIGGITLYRELRPFFIGLIVGFYLGVGISLGIDAFWFFGKGHGISHG